MSSYDFQSGEVYVFVYANLEAGYRLEVRWFFSLAYFVAKKCLLKAWSHIRKQTGFSWPN